VAALSERSDAGCFYFNDASTCVKFLFLSYGSSFELNSVSVVNQAVQDRIRNRRITDLIMPVFDGELAGDQRRTRSMALFDDFEQIPSLGVSERSQPQVVDQKQMRFRESFHQGAIASIGTGQGDLIEEVRRAEIKSSEAFSAEGQLRGHLAFV